MTEYVVVSGGASTIKITSQSRTPSPVQVAAPVADKVTVADPDATRLDTFTWGATGLIEPVASTHPLYAEVDYVLETTRAALSTPADRDVIVDLLLDGVSIYPDPSRRPTIPAGAYTGLGDNATTALKVPRGKRLTVSVIQGGLVQKGTGLTVTVRLRPSDKKAKVAVTTGQPVESFVWSSSGLALGPVQGLHRLYAEGRYEVSSIRASLGDTADRPVVIDVLRNGSSLFTGSPLTIATGNRTRQMTSGFNATTAHGDYFTVTILGAGLVETGGGLTVTMRLKRLN